MLENEGVIMQPTSELRWLQDPRSDAIRPTLQQKWVNPMEGIGQTYEWRDVPVVMAEMPKPAPEPPKPKLEGRLRVLAEAIELCTGMWHGELKPADRLVQDLGFDSLDCVTFMMEMEERYNLQINDEEWEKVKTIQDVIDLLEAHGAHE